jgi:hypothetical protein
MYYMPGLVWKSVNGEKRLVMRWKKRINGKLKITKEIYIGDMENLADMIEHPLKDSHVISLYWIQLDSDNMSMEKDLYRGRVKGGGVFNPLLIAEVMEW